MKIDSNRAELTVLQGELRRLEGDLRALRMKASQLESRMLDQERAEEAPPIIEAEPDEPVIIAAPVAEPHFQPVPAAGAPPVIERPVFEPAPAPSPAPAWAASLPKDKEGKANSFEMRLGTYWFVRVGIVMVLTAMVFLGNYAYHHYVGLLGPWGKVALMFCGSFGLIGAGVWLPRRQPQLNNYSQVLFGGGLAGVYFTTYAAHHFPNLRIIDSALVDGALLLGWTGFVAWLADRKKSELLAVFAIGLAYYTSLVTNVGNFTLLANLTLAGAAVFFLARNRWVQLSFLSVAASYGTYFYWRHLGGTGMVNETVGRLAVVGYWLIFTAGVFLARHPEFVGIRRARFLTFNNGAAFALLTASFLQLSQGEFWKLAMAAGAALLGLAALARKLLEGDELPRRAYFAQGLLLATLGLMTKLTGPTLATVLAIESVCLLIFSTQWRSSLMRNAAMVVGTLSVFWMFGSILDGAPGTWWKAVGVLVPLLFNAQWASRQEGSVGADGNSMRLEPAYYAAAGLTTWIAAVSNLGSHGEVGPVLALTTLALTASHYWLKSREITLLGQAALGVAQLHTLGRLFETPLISAWSIGCVIAVSVALAVWWKRQQALTLDGNVRLALQILAAFAAAGMVYVWLPRELAPDRWILASVGVALAWTAGGAAARSGPLAAAGQVFIVGGALMTLPRLFGQNPPPVHCVIALILGFIALASAARFARVPESGRDAVRVMSNLYHWAAAILALASVMAYVEPPFRFLALTLLFSASLIAAMRGADLAFAPGVMLAGAGVGYWAAFEPGPGAGAANFVAILALGASQFGSRKLSARLPLPETGHQVWISLVGLSLWLFVSRWVIAHSAGADFYLTASWAALALILIAAGFALRERPYRWVALVVLGSAATRVMVLDVWKLQTIYRILSFFALGVALLALGYFYTRFQDRISKWL